MARRELTHRQDNLHCSDVECKIGQEEYESTTVGFSVTASLTAWLSAGFSVSQTWETGNSQECGGKAGDEICIWQKIAHTAVSEHAEIVYECG